MSIFNKLFKKSRVITPTSQLNASSDAKILSSREDHNNLSLNELENMIKNPNNNQDFKFALDALKLKESGLNALKEGNNLYNEEKYSYAIEKYNIAIDLIPSIDTTYYYRGLCQLELENFNKAILDFSFSIEKDASNKDQSYYQRSEIRRIKLNDDAGALNDLNIAIELNPNDPAFYYSRAILLDDDSALEDLTKAIALDPENPDNYFARNLKFAGRGEYQNSISDLTQYINFHDEYCQFSKSQALVLRGGLKILQSQNKNEANEAIDDFTNAIIDDRFNANAYFERGIVFELLKEYHSAIRDFDMVIELDPSNGDAYYQRGSIKQLIGRADEGIMDVIIAKTLGFDGYDPDLD